MDSEIMTPKVFRVLKIELISFVPHEIAQCSRRYWVYRRPEWRQVRTECQRLAWTAIVQARTADRSTWGRTWDPPQAAVDCDRWRANRLEWLRHARTSRRACRVRASWLDDTMGGSWRSPWTRRTFAACTSTCTRLRSRTFGSLLCSRGFLTIVHIINIKRLL